MNMMAMALQLARLGKASVEKRALCPVETLNAASQNQLSVPEGFGEYARLLRCKSLKAFWFPASLRLVSGHIRSNHSYQIYGSEP